ncbi:MAG: transglycosylase SLT domain-containing protein [Bacteroidales bacterium]|jgi:membrane-bound lytic murein transglycosylase D|nr:transglycosylase SLT domain-containing protein [Bacteroidales bacterium]HOL97244.1 transglycosylase SLT domain-containing protein [Bacteroidales bacterium]HOM35536.1 transglycosylase SLT domain-containing protein [Bacteroidales bacterium]HPD23843.1 transglycosylase SLT domain-containing protein [Bacteroidales bacterium]HRS98767.1 transglycosylase SLT domain-containing protein [Bacteroidales bacterium]
MKHIFSFILFLLCFFSSFAVFDGDMPNKSTAKTFKNIYEKIDYGYFKYADSLNFNRINKLIKKDSINHSKAPVFPDEIYRARINDLNERTPVKLEYNEHVKYFIEAYSLKNRPKLINIIERSYYYFPIFEEYLDKYKLPLELKYLAAVESSLDPTAVSKSGAVGLWQFIISTGEILGLNVTSYVDERRDVYKSTDAACRYLKYLYETFGDWYLVLAAYNGGPGAVKKAIARGNGSTNYWQIRGYMSEQMQRYVPAFIAMTYLMNYSYEHALFPANPMIPYYKTDTLIVNGPLYLKNIATTINVDLEQLKALNPIYTYQYIPNDGNKYPLVLPFEKTNVFLDNYHNIKDNSLAEKQKDSTVNTPFVEQKERNREIIYVVKPGESLFRIAVNHDTTVTKIREWNNLPDNYVLKAGDKIKILVE